MSDDVKNNIQEENLEQVEETVEEAVEEIVEETVEEIAEDETETIEDVVEDAIDDTSVVEEHAKEDDNKWADVFSRLDALEQRIGELMLQGGPEKAALEEEDELSEIELENQKWYERNAQMRNFY